MMMNLSESELIASKPIGNGLEAFRNHYRSICEELGIPRHEDTSKQFSLLLEAAGSGDVKVLIVDLISELQRLPAARILPSRSGLGTLAGDLAIFYSRLDSNEVEVESAVPLLDQIIKTAPDSDIWHAVYTLVSKFRTTPPTILGKAPPDTPYKTTSSSLQGSEQLHRLLDERILQEVNGCVYTDMKGFYEKYFEGRAWSSTAERIAGEARPQVINGRWTGYPDPPSESAFYTWFWKFQSTHFRGTRGMYYSSPTIPLSGSDCKRKPDLFLALSGTTKRDGKYNWRDVRVIGELKQSVNEGDYREEFAKFCGHAREVFTSQPTRHFLHGFFIRGSILELWVFDRSGPYSCERFDVRADPNRFIKIMAGYAMMSDDELGLNTYIKKDDYSNYIILQEEGKAGKEKLRLEDKPIAYQHAIVCRGTTCYRAKRLNTVDWEFVVKFSWRSDKRRAEGELLQLAKDRRVWGVAQLFGYQDLNSIANLRRGLHFGSPRKFRSVTGSESQSSGKSSCLRRSLSKNTAPSLSRATVEGSSSGQKRKRACDAAGNHQSKQSRLGSSSCQTSARRNEITAEQNTDFHDANKYGIEKIKPTSLMPLKEAEDDTFDNRIFCCLVVSPPGRALHTFESVLEFLEACCDAIKGHRSLYQEGEILHRDVSVNNVIITDAENREDPKGMLIDLDLAKQLDHGLSGARHRTGTMEFMAIEVLEGAAHTYRHDLESFFYVFLWVIIRYGQGVKRDLPMNSRLRRWYTGTYADIADNKFAAMDKRQFGKITSEFPSQFEGVKPLAEELRDVLFPIRDRSLFTGTYSDPKGIDSMYDGMINAFQRKIGTYGKTDGGSGDTQKE
ncbi:MAG: hypothetical protein Q9163_006079 [Psora crenata]